VTIASGDLIQINGRFTTAGTTEVVSSNDGYTVNGTKQFKDDNATFQTNNVAVGDILWIMEDNFEGFYVIASVDSQTQITVTAAGNFTSTTVLNYEIWTSIIFKGRIVDRNFEKVKTVLCESEAEEIDKQIETDFYCGRLGGLVQELLDHECAFINHSFTQTSPYNYRAPHNFRNEADGTYAGDSYWNNLYKTGTATIEVLASLSGHKKVMELDSGTGAAQFSTSLWNKLYDTMEFYIRFAQNNKKWQLQLDDDQITFYPGVRLKWDTDGNLKYLTGDFATPVWNTIEAYSANIWYKLKIKYDITNEDGIGDDTHDWHFWIDDVSKDGGSGYAFWHTAYLENRTMKNFYFASAATAAGIAYFDAFGSVYDNNYILGVNADVEYNELIYTTEFLKYPMTEKTMRLYFNSYADKHLKVWYITPTYEILFNDGDVDSGIDLNASSNYKNAEGKKQVKAIDKVHLKGGIVDGVRIFSTYGAGDVIAKDTYAHILDQSDLDDMAQQVFSRQSAGILNVALDYQELSYGYIQIGEEMTIVGNTIRFRRSDEYIATVNTQFKLRGERLQLGENAVIIYSELYLDDVLLFQRSEQADTQKATEENSQLISEVGIGTTVVGGVSGGGADNTITNIGAAGVGVYKQKVGIQFQLKNINAGSNKITITDDTTNDEVDIDLDISQILEDTPSDAQVLKAPTSNWAFDHQASPTNIKHLTDLQLAALHAKYTNAEAVAAVAAGDDYLKLVGDTMGGAINMGTYNITNVNIISTRSIDSYDKLRVWNSNLYTIGMRSAMSYGGLNSYAMTFTMNNDAARGFVWRDSDDAQNDGAMSLTTGGILTVKESITIGTGAITSDDGNLLFTFGRGAIGSPITTFAAFAHRYNMNSTDYGFMQASDGRTYINAMTGKTISFSINAVDKMNMNVSALTMSLPIAMGTNKITGLAAPTANGDALRYENISNLDYDPLLWTQTNVAASKRAIKDALVPLTGALIYSGTWTPGTDPYPEPQTSGTVGSTAGTSVFTDATKNFTALGVEVGDILNIREGVDLGFYIIDIVGTTTVTCTGDTFGTVSNLEYQIFRSVSGEYWICDADGNYDTIAYEVSDWLVWNETEIEWNRLRNKYGDNVISVAPGDSIQNAINEIASIGGGTVFLLAGTHNDSTDTFPITINNTNNPYSSPIVIRGAGESTIIDPNSYVQVFDIDKTDICILQNFNIDITDYTGNVKGAIDINEIGAHKVVCNNLHIYGDGTNGVGVWSQSAGVEILSCIFTSISVGVTLQGNYSIVSHNQGYGLASCLVAYSGVGNIVSTNIAFNCGLGIISNGATYYVLDGNVIYNPGVYGIKIINASSYGAISNNVIHSAGNDGIEITGSSLRNNLNGNVIVNGSAYGINIEAGSNYNSIGPNIIYNNASGDINNNGTGTIDYDSLHAIGTANAKWKPLSAGPSNPPSAAQSDGYNISNTGATNFFINWYIPLSPTLGALKLYIKSVELGLQDATGTDYVDIIYLFNMTTHAVRNTLMSNGANLIAAGTYTYVSGAPYDMSASKTMWLFMGCAVNNAQRLDISVVRVEYYYDT